MGYKVSIQFLYGVRGGYVVEGVSYKSQLSESERVSIGKRFRDIPTAKDFRMYLREYFSRADADAVKISHKKKMYVLMNYGEYVSIINKAWGSMEKANGRAD